MGRFVPVNNLHSLAHEPNLQVYNVYFSYRPYDISAENYAIYIRHSELEAYLESLLRIFNLKK